MTTNVPKGAGRAAATARTRKHAQRTPLPPKPGAIEDARMVLDFARGVQDASSNGEATDDRSLTKAQAFAVKAVALDWKAVISPVGGAVEVTATRGAETVVQAWSGGVWQYDASIYAYGDRTTKPRNASGALKLLSRSEADASAEASKVVSNRSFRKAEPKDITVTLEKAQRTLPFDPELATDEEISGVMAGQAVVWYNRIGRSNESAIVGRSGVRITRLPDGQRVANFCCPVTGFRSCLVTALLKVGRGKSLVTAGSQTAAVEVS
jgi:hypothetical protein